MKIKPLYSFLLLSLSVTNVQAHSMSDKDAKDIVAIKQAALNYIESQHDAAPEKMEQALHRSLAKRTYWKKAAGKEEILETNYLSMLQVAKNYNKSGTKFPQQPLKAVQVLDLDKRVATVKLTADEWIDYMHLVKLDDGQWKILNVLWQYRDISRHDKSK
jgi:hypothetical protein